MSARMQVEPADWETTEALSRESVGRHITEIQIERFFRNSDNRNLVAPLREIHEALTENRRTEGEAEEKRKAAVALQEQWEAWSTEREELRNEIKRGRECLEQVREELTALRSGLEEWPTYEKICGKNPLPEYMQALAAKEQIDQFLPGWVSRREEQLLALGHKMELCARQNGIEHLL